MSLIELMASGKKPATKEDLSQCSYCKRAFKKYETIYMKAHGLGAIIIDEKCRKKYYSKAKVV